MKELSLDLLIAEGTTQARMPDPELEKRYAEAMKDGAVFPPIVAFEDDRGIFLADGFHRRGAAKIVGRKALSADVRPPLKGETAQRSAILYAVGANDEHGRNRSNDDKRHAVQMLLRDPEWSKWTNNEIARQCRVDNKFVGRQRDKLINDGVLKKDEKRQRKDKHGNVSKIDTTKIGRTQKPSATPEQKKIAAQVRAGTPKAESKSKPKFSGADALNLSDLKTSVDLLALFPMSAEDAAAKYRGETDRTRLRDARGFLDAFEAALDQEDAA